MKKSTMKKSTMIIQHDLLEDGTQQFVAAYDTSTQASKYSGVPYSTIRYSVRGEQFGKMKFTQQPRKAMHNATRGKMRVTQRDSNDRVVAVFANMSTTAELTKISSANIRKVLNTGISIDKKSYNG